MAGIYLFADPHDPARRPFTWEEMSELVLIFLEISIQRARRKHDALLCSPYIEKNQRRARCSMLTGGESSKILRWILHGTALRSTENQ